jgi:hypothetical protein
MIALARASINFVNDRPILSSEKMFYKDFERKRLIKKKYGRDPQGA